MRMGVVMGAIILFGLVGVPLQHRVMAMLDDYAPALSRDLGG